jgi:hypothetical protein
VFHVKRLLVAAALLFPSLALADPSEADKVAALKLAYRINNNSMVGGMIDLTDPGTLARAASLPDIEDSGPGVWPRLEQPKQPRVQTAEVDICTRHGLKKTIRGKSWRCKR